jgi:hypothetical protein
MVAVLTREVAVEAKAGQEERGGEAGDTKGGGQWRMCSRYLHQYLWWVQG